MKKSSYLFGLITITILSISIYSCTKAESTIESDTIDTSIDIDNTTRKIKEITNNYIESTTSNSRDSGDYLLHERDVNAYYDSFVFRENDLITAIIDGIAASFEYARTHGPNSINRPPIDNSIILNENSYDNVGLYHVKILDHILKDRTGTYYRNNTLNYAAVLNYSNQFMAARNMPAYTGDHRDLETSVLNAANVLTEANNYLPNLITPTNNAETILKEYFTALENSNSATEFVTFSKTVELLIINSQQFSNKDKKYLLTNMATSRHDFSYWRS